jgi:hypothetical protein
MEVVDFPVVRRNNLPYEHGRSRVVIIEAARLKQAISRNWDGIHILRHEFIKFLGEPAVGGMVLLTGRHDSLSVRLGDPELKALLALTSPNVKAGIPILTRARPQPGRSIAFFRRLTRNQIGQKIDDMTNDPYNAPSQANRTAAATTLHLMPRKNPLTPAACTAVSFRIRHWKLSTLLHPRRFSLDVSRCAAIEILTISDR